MLRSGQKTVCSIRLHLAEVSGIHTLDARVLAGSLSALAVLCTYRFYNYWISGFFVPDEFGYYFNAVHGAIYSDRWFFGWMNIFLFKALGITNVDAFSYLLPFYLFFWTGLTFIILYKLLRLLGFDEVVTSLTLLSSFILVVFILLSLGFLTEPVGLSLTVLGIYFLARYMKSESARGNIIFPLLAACLFGFAAGTREPYNAFLVGGIAIVLILAYSKRRSSLRSKRIPPKALLAVSVLAFTLPSMFFLFVPTQAYSQQVGPISSQLLQSLVSNPQTSGAPVTTVTTVTSTSVITSTRAITTTAVVDNSTTTFTKTTTTTTTTTTATETTIASSIPFYRQFIATNTLLIFFGGIALGWGPICLALALAGFLILMRRSLRSEDITARFMILTSLVALGSYFVVSFINAPSPYYFSFQNYSTVIRFSDTALPAYFMTAPFILSKISKSRRRMTGLAAVSVAFLLIAVPVYQTYAASNLNHVSQNPFQLGYHTDAAVMRNYFTANDRNQPIYLVGVPYGWQLTPGLQDLDVHAYSIGQQPLFPELTLTNFTSMRWQVFYIYVNSPPSTYPPESQFLLQFINSTQALNTNDASSFAVLGARPVLHGSDFTLYEVNLRWS
jgi:hypothetical protein